jgi:hypothetical protein
MPASTVPGGVEAFIARWQDREGGQERANYALFPSELCDGHRRRPPRPCYHPHRGQ